MTPSVWRKVKEIVGDAVEQRPADREAFVHQAADGHEEVEREALRLLASHDEPDVALDGPSMATGMLGAAANLHAFYPGETLAGRYIVRRFLASGGMGEVYEAEDTELAERVALKTLHPEIAGAEHVIWLRREIQAARKISHPNVCRVYDLVQTETGDGRPIVFLTMELLEGETLNQRLERDGAMSERQALPLVRQMVAALSAAHQQGIVHRDFKTGNIMIVTRPGAASRLVVTDFGLARPQSAGQRQSSDLRSRSTAITVGTPAYMAPEQIEGGKIGPAADIYALGVVLYELLTGELPFGDDSPIKMMANKLRKQPDSLMSLLPAVRPNWNRAVRRCLQTNPRDRFRDAGQVLQELEVRSRRKKIWLRLIRQRRVILHRTAAAAGIAVMATLIWWLWPINPGTQALRDWQAGVAALRAGEAVLAAGRLEEAVSHYRLPDLARAQLAQAWLTAGFPTRAGREIAVAVARPLQSQADREYERAVQAQLAGKMTVAHGILEDRARKLAGIDQAAAVSDLASFEETAGKPDAVANWNRVLAIRPADPVALLWSAVHRAKVGDTSGAEASFLVSETYFHGLTDEALVRVVSARRGLANLNAGLTEKARQDIPALSKLLLKPGLGYGTCDRVLTLMAGIDDRFAMPPDPIETASKALQKSPAYTGSIRSFDEQPHNQAILFSIPLPRIPVCSAQFETRIRRLNRAGANNDTISFVLNNSGRDHTRFLWDQDFNAEERLGNYNITDAVRYSLSNPNDPASPSLDIVIQNDTVVDYFKLMLVY